MFAFAPSGLGLGFDYIPVFLDRSWESRQIFIEPNIGEFPKALPPVGNLSQVSVAAKHNILKQFLAFNPSANGFRNLRVLILLFSCGRSNIKKPSFAVGRFRLGFHKHGMSGFGWEMPRSMGTARPEAATCLNKQQREGWNSETCP